MNKYAAVEKQMQILYSIYAGLSRGRFAFYALRSYKKSPESGLLIRMLSTTYGRGELRSPARDRRSPLRIIKS